MILQEGAAAEAEHGREAAITRRLQHKIAKRVQFLKNVATSQPALKLGVQQAGTKKKRRKDRGPGRLGDLSNLTASLAEAAQEVHQIFCAPASPESSTFPWNTGDGALRVCMALTRHCASSCTAILSQVIDFEVQKLQRRYDACRKM